MFSLKNTFLILFSHQQENIDPSLSLIERTFQPQNLCGPSVSNEGLWYHLGTNRYLNEVGALVEQEEHGLSIR